MVGKATQTFDDAFPTTPFDDTINELIGIREAVDRNTAAVERLIALLTKPKAAAKKASVDYATVKVAGLP